MPNEQTRQNEPKLRTETPSAVERIHDVYFPTHVWLRERIVVHRVGPRGIRRYLQNSGIALLTRERQGIIEFPERWEIIVESSILC